MAMAWSGSDVLDEAAGHAVLEEAALPPGFESEVIAAVDQQDVRFDEQGRIVGFCVAGIVEEVFFSLADELTGKGWICVESGSASCGSFAKGAGAYRWAFVSCVQVGDSTSVVVQYATTDEGS